MTFHLSPSAGQGAAFDGVPPPREHELKCWPQFFDAIATGRKRHDLRRAYDRDFRVDDTLRLREFDPATNVYTGREQVVHVTYVTSAEEPCALSGGALHSDYCILSIARPGDL